MTLTASGQTLTAEFGSWRHLWRLRSRLTCLLLPLESANSCVALRVVVRKGWFAIQVLPRNSLWSRLLFRYFV